MPTTPTPRPNVPLPAGALSADIWEYGERVVLGPPHSVPMRSDVVVRASAIQRADGTVAPRPEPPAVRVDLDSDVEFTAEQARQLAAALLDAADQADEWAGR